MVLRPGDRRAGNQRSAAELLGGAGPVPPAPRKEVSGRRLHGPWHNEQAARHRHLAVEHIGKEANRWEEQFYVGLHREAQTEYGIAPEDVERTLSSLRMACERLGRRAVAKAVRMSISDVSALLHGKRSPTAFLLTRLSRAVARLKASADTHEKMAQSVEKIAAAKSTILGSKLRIPCGKQASAVNVRAKRGQRR